MYQAEIRQPLVTGGKTPSDVTEDICRPIENKPTSSWWLGFTIAALGILPPGLINMTAAKVSVVDGRNQAISFAIGATVIVLFQTYVAIQFAKFISSRHDIITLLQEIGLYLFLAITIFLFWTAKKPKKEKQEINLTEVQRK